MDKELQNYIKENLNLIEDLIYLLDYKEGDVTGDGIPDKVYLIGNKEEPDAGFTTNIRLIVKLGDTGSYITVFPENAAGYEASLFLGDFNKDNINDIFISIVTGGSGGQAFYYIYSFINAKSNLIFYYEDFNEAFDYEVIFKDYYKVEVINETLNQTFIIDLSDRDPEYLSEIYNENGTLKEPIEGFVIPLGSLFPIYRHEDDNYDLLAIQRVVGRYNADTIGYPHTYLTWEEDEFNVFFYTVGLVGQPYYNLNSKYKNK